MNTRNLSESRRLLVTKIRTIGFGTIEKLVVEDGEPKLDRCPFFVTNVIFGAKAADALPTDARECELKAQFAEMFCQFDRRKNFTIKSLEIKDRLPFKMSIEGDPM
jgi:hypothetical protein